MSVVLPVAKRGEDILKLIAAPVSANELNSNWLYQLADAMHATMLERNGVGIAAPQVYISKRVIIVASRPNPRYPCAPTRNANRAGLVRTATKVAARESLRHSRASAACSSEKAGRRTPRAV